MHNRKQDVRSGKSVKWAGLIQRAIQFNCFSYQVQGHVEDAVDKGAKVLIGGKRPDLPLPYNKVLPRHSLHLSQTVLSSCSVLRLLACCTA